jgi:hypothetical protein
VLWFERQVVGTLMDPALDATTRSAVESYVSTTLRSMPEHLRAGVAAESMVLGASSWVEQRIGRLTWLPRAPLRSASSALVDQGRLRTRVDSWKTSKIDPIRQYVRLLESLVLFAENELGP